MSEIREPIPPRICAKCGGEIANTESHSVYKDGGFVHAKCPSQEGRMTLRKEQPVFFRKIPVTEQTPPNATVNRYVGPLNGEQVVEIVHAGAKWLVRESELLDVDAALARRAEELNARIEALKPKHSRKTDLIRALGICESTYRRWNRIIQNYLPKVQGGLPATMTEGGPA